MKAPTLTTYAEAVARFPSTTILAMALGLPGSTCRSWVSRDAIPPEYFAPIGEAARQLGVPLTERQLWALFNDRARASMKGLPRVGNQP